ncbi:MAG: 1-deoxy-D-xylulose-5-phosphate reductoisomerase [Hyphomicrobiales bacterium]|nr:1-deoxy-D-xylulose-5-phosphate reductoisomerase [Hyphomicrobiales bacterium]
MIKQSKKNISILGSTGSIGKNTLSIPSVRDNLFIHALIAGKNINLLTEQSLAFRPKYAVIFEEKKYKELKSNLFGSGIKIKSGKESVLDVISQPTDIVLSAISGSAGIEPTLSAINNTEKLAIANKESIVTCGNLLFDKKINHKTSIVPVDSEHNAIYNLLKNVEKKNLKEIILTASGGPFLSTPIEQLSKVTVEDALKHPTWNMGKKITIDSATLINKGLELIEASYLFQINHKKIRVLVHPESIIHGMVSMKDGTTNALLSIPDMKIPISNAIFGTVDNALEFKNINFYDIEKLTFKKPDNDRFPALKMARDAIDLGPQALVAYNAASEVAVQNFLLKKISFSDIYKVMKSCLVYSETLKNNDISNLKNILSLGHKIKTYASNTIKEKRWC